MRRVRAVFALSLLAVAVATHTPLFAARAATREPVYGRYAMVASTHRIASEVGLAVLRRGGNAVDAAVATALALAVVYPAAGNLGGGGFMLIRLKDGRTTAIDYREAAPSGATRNMYLDASGALDDDASTVGYRASAVPGTPAGLALALEQYGTMKWRDVIEPARRLAQNGYVLDPRDERFLAGESKKLAMFPDSRRIFLRDGVPFKAGEIFKQPDLARTLGRLERNGPREFYEGETARMIASDMRAHGGLITLDDLKAYKAREREPIRGSYRGYPIISMPSPSSGGVVLIEMLNMLEHFDLAGAGSGSSLLLHIEAEVMRRAFADRAEYLGDADFVTVPTAELTSKEYAERRAATIDLNHASASKDVGPGLNALREGTQTTHFTVVDKDGTVVSNTYTLNLLYGCGVVAAGTGVLLNNEMDDFAAKPGEPNSFGLIQKENNAIAPGKRPLSAMTPTMVLNKDGSFWFAVGSPGGPTIINTVLQVIVNVIDLRMDIQAAVDTPRIHHQWLPDRIVFEPYGMPRDVQDALRARGHTLFDQATIADSVRPGLGDAQAVMIDPVTRMRLGASDARRPGVALGY